MKLISSLVLVMLISLVSFSQETSKPILIKTTTVNAADYSNKVAPGSIAAMFGSSHLLSAFTISQTSTTFPLPVEVSGFKIEIGGIPAPIFYLGVGGALGEGNFQINLQIPFEVETGNNDVGIYVKVPRADKYFRLSKEQLKIQTYGPGIFTINASGTGQAAALNPDYSLNSEANPAVKGSYVSVYATGGGRYYDELLVESNPGTANQTPLSPLYITQGPFAVKFNGIDYGSGHYFYGLAPNYASLDQINLRIPESCPSGLVTIQFFYNGEQTGEDVHIWVAGTLE